MLLRVLTALALVCVLSNPVEAKPRDAVAIAERYIGTNPTRMARLWCHAFANMVLQKAGHKGSGSNFARSGLKIGKPVALAKAKRGDLVVLARGKRGGHSGFFRRRLPNGRIELVSGNTRGGVVGISSYAPSRVLGVRRPS